MPKKSTVSKRDPVPDADPPKPQPGKSQLPLLILLALVIAGPVVIAIAFTGKSTKISSVGVYPKTLPGVTVTGAVSQMRWPAGKPFTAAEFASKATPQIVKGTAVEQWPALKKWTMEYLRKATPENIPGIYFHKVPRFGPLWRPKKPMTKLPNLKWENPHQYIDLTSEQFFSRIVSPPRDSQGNVTEYMYYTGDLNQPALIRDIEPYFEFVVKGRPTINVWVGQAGVVAHTHLDSYDNFFFQIKGRKRFLLFPPEQQSNLYPYPFLHPSFAQAQVNIDAPDFAAYPKLRNAVCLEADLQPGDMLYLPPLWWHYVLSVDQSVSVNIWSVNLQQDGFDAVIQQTVKSVNSQWPLELKRHVAHYVITQLFAQLAKDLNAAGSSTGLGWEQSSTPATAFVQNLVSERYAQLISVGQIPTDPLDKTIRACDWPELTQDDKAAMSGVIKAAVETFGPKTIKREGNRHWWLANYVESLGIWSCLTGDVVAAFFTQCFKPPTVTGAP